MSDTPQEVPPPLGDQKRESQSWTEAYKINPHYHGLLVAQATKSVIDQIDERNHRNRNSLIAGLSAAIAALAAISGFLINELLDVRIEKSVRAALDAELSSQRIAFDIAQLRMEAFSSDIKDHFSNREAEERIGRVQDIYASAMGGTFNDQRRRSILRELVQPAHTIRDSFASANRTDYVFRITKAIPEVFELDTDGSLPVVLSLAQDFSGSNNAPDSWSDETHYDSAVRRMLNSELAKLSATYPELVMLVDALTATIEQPRDHDRIVSAFANVSDLSDNDQESLKSFLNQLRDGGFYSDEVETEIGGRIRRRTEVMLSVICQDENLAVFCDEEQQPYDLDLMTAE